MKTSYNWLKDYLSFDLSPEKLGEVLTEIGLEVEGLEKVSQIEGDLEGVKVGHVLTCEQHPNADRLRVTTVDIGGEEPLPIVCGAPNVAAGQKVLVATVGTTLYPAGSDGFKIKKSKIRGESSYGMICAEDELGLGQSHDGIMVLDAATEVGKDARDVLDLDIDYVYEIGLTPNRSDATCHLGVAKDVLAALMINYDHDGQFNAPDISDIAPEETRPYEVEVVDEALCPRFCGVLIDGFEVKESPAWIQKRLASVGVRPINNIVDITNFILHEMGQPLHAYDASKIGADKVKVETLPEGTPFTTLDTVERKLRGKDLMVCDGNDKPMCIAGVFGGTDSGVTDNTTTIFLESAHFDAQTLRNTSMAHQLRTDAAKVFEKGSDPNVCMKALKRAVHLILESGGGKVVSNYIDVYPSPVAPTKIKVRTERVSQLIGTPISFEEQKRILEAMEMEVTKLDDASYEVAVPTNKADVTREVDIVEEVLRIYGFNRVSDTDAMSISTSYQGKSDEYEIKNRVGNYLSAIGFHEIMGLSLITEEFVSSAHEQEYVKIHNTSNTHLEYMRSDMLSSMLSAFAYNANRHQNHLKVFEFGRVFRKREGQFLENQVLGVAIKGRVAAPSWDQQEQQADYYFLKGVVSNLLALFNIGDIQEKESDHADLVYGQSIHFRGKELGYYGLIKEDRSRVIGQSGELFYAELNWDELIGLYGKFITESSEGNKYPSMSRDLALVVDQVVKYADLAQVCQKTGKKLLKKVSLFDVYENEDQLGAGKKSYGLAMTFQHDERTLTDQEIDKVMDKIVAALHQKFKLVIRK